jgi:hypothetical protein
MIDYPALGNLCTRINTLPWKKNLSIAQKLPPHGNWWFKAHNQETQFDLKLAFRYNESSNRQYSPVSISFQAGR